MRPLAALFLGLASIAIVDSTLLLVQILFRHGMRAPENPYPTDPFQNETLYWPNGWGQLTQFGKEQQYNIGTFLRSRYASFLSPTYSPKELYVISSDYDRTVMSALLTLAGLYPEKGFMELNWEPIPVHTFGSGQNNLMLHPSYISRRAVCPRYYTLFHKDMKTYPEFVKVIEEKAELIEFIRTSTGSPANKTWLHMFGGDMGTVKIEKFYNLSIPDWARQVLAVKDNLELFARSYAFLTLTDEMKRLLAGPIISEWMAHVKDKMAGNDTRKLFMYSAHDLNLVSVLNTMGLNDPPFIPEMGSTLFLELHQEGTGAGAVHTLKLLYRDGLSNALNELSLPGCGQPCTVDDFANILAPFILDLDLGKECQDQTASASNGWEITTTNGILICVICGLVVSLVALQIWHVKQNRKKSFSVYS